MYSTTLNITLLSCLHMWNWTYTCKPSLLL